MESIRLRHTIFEDYKSILSFVTNTDVAKYLTWSPHKNKNEIDRYFNKIINTISFPDETLLIEYYNKIIGSVHFISRGDNCTQFGFGLLPKYWNKGLGTETVRLCLKHLARSDWSKNTRELWADVDNRNKYAIRILLKYKFSLLNKNVSENRDRYLVMRYE